MPADVNHPEPPPDPLLSHDPSPASGTHHDAEKPDSHEPDPSPVVDPGEVE
jgi:hypothetical protein